MMTNFKQLLLTPSTLHITPITNTQLTKREQLAMTTSFTDCKMNVITLFVGRLQGILTLLNSSVSSTCPRTCLVSACKMSKQ